ncbi:hypothetical protein L596_009900 [Steinernema carpocapsae]|uniref:Uncharacterized protein n=1 Tax=Steinernema carpocapsae TaxID=34508 RepID=A0A4U5PH77_STECR|nr:hypothetical protein L596_009900 [Steinernema carpocapsae]
MEDRSHPQSTNVLQSFSDRLSFDFGRTVKLFGAASSSFLYSDLIAAFALLRPLLVRVWPHNDAVLRCVISSPTLCLDSRICIFEFLQTCSHI